MDYPLFFLSFFFFNPRPWLPSSSTFWSPPNPNSQLLLHHRCGGDLLLTFRSLGVRCTKFPGGRYGWKFSGTLAVSNSKFIPLKEPEPAKLPSSEMQEWEAELSHVVISGANPAHIPWFLDPCFFCTGDKSVYTGHWFSMCTVSCRMHCILTVCSAVSPADNSVPLLGQPLLGDVICKRPVGPLVRCPLPHLFVVKWGCCWLWAAVLWGLWECGSELWSRSIGVLTEGLWARKANSH